MTQELRIILFSDEELAQAIALYLHHQSITAVQGRVTILSKRGYPRVEAEYAIGFGAAAQVQRLGGEALASALILYCIKRKIPLPKDIAKALHILDDRIGLILDRDFPREMARRLFAPAPRLLERAG